MHKLLIIRDPKQALYYPFSVMPMADGKPVLETGIVVSNVDNLASLNHRLDRALQGAGRRLAEFEWLPELTVVTTSVGEIAEAVFSHIHDGSMPSTSKGWPDEELMANVWESDDLISFEGLCNSARISKSRLIDTVRRRLAFRP